ncbi:putative flavoprotein involved in K+ transport [Rhodospirillales bacterium URHD0017]|nr:putative flavoprotein involved in K+ transport [Rhodospirillales bacterium URHD0017]
MSVEEIDTLVVGGGQAGLAMSEHLSQAGVPHIVVERHRIAERWRSERWDSLVANGPAWHDRFPGLAFSDVDRNVGSDDFAPKETVADYFVAYAKKIAAPIRCGVDVLKVERRRGHPGFRVETSTGVIEANSVVAATGSFQRPVVPELVPRQAPIEQMHSTAYRNPAQLADGAILVVGSGSSGTQIAEELLESGRRVYLSMGPHDRPPRAYRGRDYCWWLGVLGKWDAVAREPGREHVTIAVSGVHGGHTIDFRRLATRGIILVGRTEAYADGAISFASDLVDNLERGDLNLRSLLDEADTYVVRNGLDLPEEVEARAIGPDSDCIANPLSVLDLVKTGITTIIWATGFVADYSWIELDIFNEDGRPKHQRGVSTEPGLYFLGLPWQSRRGSSFIWGVWHDAKYLADQIATQRKYLDYHLAARGSRPQLR